MVSMWVAPYSTFLDELVLLPAVVAGIFFVRQDGRPNKATLPIFFALNGIAFVLLFAQVPVMSGAYVWSTTAWLAWFLYATHESRTSRAMTEAQRHLVENSGRP